MWYTCTCCEMILVHDIVQVSSSIPVDEAASAHLSGEQQHTCSSEMMLVHIVQVSSTRTCSGITVTLCKLLHLCASVIKQYNLVLAKEW